MTRKPDNEDNPLLQNREWIGFANLWGITSDSISHSKFIPKSIRNLTNNISRISREIFNDIR